MSKSLNTPPIPARSTQDPAFERDARELAQLARQLADRIDILTDTAPADLSSLAVELLRGATESAARTLDTLAWLTEAGRPLPEPAALPERTETHHRYWVWRHVGLDLVEVVDEPTPCAGEHIVVASWSTRPGRPGHELEVALFGPLTRTRDDLSFYLAAACPWEIGALRITAAQQALSPVLRAVLRELLLEALEQAPTMPPIRIETQRKPLVEVPSA